MSQYLRLLMLLLWASPVAAGPWPRAEGTSFAALGGNVALFQAERPIHYDPTYYIEYGFTPALTVGVEGFSADKGYANAELMFARYPVAETLALSLAWGLMQLGPPTNPDHTAIVTRVGLHWGRSIEDGWLTADLSLLDDVYRETDPKLALLTTFRQAKLDATWGRNLSEEWQAMMQLQAGVGLNGDFYAKLAPSLSYKLSTRFKVKGGLTQALTGDLGSALNAEIWIDF